MTTEARKSCAYTDHLGITLERLARPGLLLVARGPEGKPDNAMTIGWATFGIIWGLPMCVVLVRPSRYTYGLIEVARDFTVNVPADDMAEAAAYLGTASGRDGDKLAHVGLSTAPSGMVTAPTLTACAVTYECRVVHHNDVVPAHLASNIDRGSYPRGDYHRLYYGQILATTALI